MGGLGFGANWWSRFLIAEFGGFGTWGLRDSSGKQVSVRRCVVQKGVNIGKAGLGAGG